MPAKREPANAAEWVEFHRHLNEVARQAADTENHALAIARRLPPEDDQWTSTDYTHAAAMIDELERAASRYKAAADNAYRAILRSAPWTYGQAMNAAAQANQQPPTTHPTTNQPRRIK